MTDATAGHEAAQPTSVVIRSTITCPGCGHRSTETMPTDACQYIYVCKQCGMQLKPKKGDCCVYCSYGDVPCPPIQEERPGCCSEARERTVMEPDDACPTKGEHHPVQFGTQT